EPRPPIENPYERYICVETADGEIIDLSLAQKLGTEPIPEGRLLGLQQATSQGENAADREAPVKYNGADFYPPKSRHWSVTATGMQRVVEKGRAYAVGNTLTWKSYRDEFPFRLITDNWGSGIGATGFGASYVYVVQTSYLGHGGWGVGDRLVDPDWSAPGGAAISRPLGGGLRGPCGAEVCVCQTACR